MREIAKLLVDGLTVLPQELRKLDSHIAKAASRARLRLYATRVSADMENSRWVAKVRQEIAAGIPEEDLLGPEELRRYFVERQSRPSASDLALLASPFR